MSNILSTSAARLSAVRSIGAGIRLSDTAVPMIVASAPEGFDPAVRGAVADLVHSWACGDAERPAVKVGRKGEQVTTDYGRGHDTLTKAVKAAMSADKAKPVRLAVTMSGEGAPVSGTVTVPADHPLYAALVALLVTETETAAAA